MFWRKGIVLMRFFYYLKANGLRCLIIFFLLHNISSFQRKTWCFTHFWQIGSFPTLINSLLQKLLFVIFNGLTICSKSVVVLRGKFVKAVFFLQMSMKRKTDVKISKDKKILFITKYQSLKISMISFVGHVILWCLSDLMNNKIENPQKKNAACHNEKHMPEYFSVLYCLKAFSVIRWNSIVRNKQWRTISHHRKQTVSVIVKCIYKLKHVITAQMHVQF